MRKTKISILFFLKKNKTLKSGESPICMRITINKERFEMNIQKSISPQYWNQKKEYCVPCAPDSIELNKYISEIRSNVFHLYDQLSKDGREVTLQILKKDFLKEREVQEKYLIETLHEHNIKCHELLGIDYTYSTINRYELCARYITELLRKQKGVNDILLKDVSGSFIRDFMHYLKTEKRHKGNTVVRYMKCLKKITNRAIADGVITTDPFASVKLKSQKIEREFLTPDELKRIVNHSFSIPRLQLVKDIFSFCCYTGLSFIDVQTLKPSDLIKDHQGNLWVYKKRQKTKNVCTIPLLKIPLALLNKYQYEPSCLKKNVCFPVPSNQKINSYLKEIADFCGINKNITSHTARRTFASVVTLANDVPIEMVAKILGHSDLRMTMLYTHVFDQNIYDRIMAIDNKI